MDSSSGRKRPRLLKWGGRQTSTRSRGRFARFMGRVALVALVLVVLRFVAGSTFLFGDNPLGTLLGLATFLSIFASISYYSIRLLIYIKNRLLWRVRRRLIITYLFVGMTPIVLLLMFGLISGFGLSAEALARILSVQLDTTREHLLVEARSAAAELSLTHTADPAGWLQQRVSQMQGSLPGLHASFLPAGSTTVPSWLGPRPEWSGLAYEEPPNQMWQSLRAVVRADGGIHGLAMFEIPIDESFLRHLSKQTGIDVQSSSSHVEIRSTDENGGVNVSWSDRSDGKIRSSAQTQPVHSAGLPYPVLFPAVHWSDGKEGNWVPLMFGWSLSSASRQLLGGSELGRLLRAGLVAIGITFLVLEIAALLLAGLMTRAVTGTVHELYEATEYIKRGDFTHRARVRSHDQLGELAESFNNMTSNLEMLLVESVEREKLEREVEIAAEVQSRLFPRELPQMPTVEIAAHCRAARGVAGDYYDCIQVLPGLMMLVVGDVSGKGLSASLVMSNLQASFRAQTTLLSGRSLLVSGTARAGDADLEASLAARKHRFAGGGAMARMMAVINEQLCRSTDANHFATMFIGLYEEQAGRLWYTNAGHNAPVLVHADGTVERLTHGGMVVGAFDWAAYEEACVPIEHESVLLIFSDGISEARNPGGDEYGEDRLVRLSIENRALSAERQLEAVFADVDTWSGNREIGDDQTLVVMRAARRTV